MAKYINYSKVEAEARSLMQQKAIGMCMDSFEPANVAGHTLDVQGNSFHPTSKSKYSPSYSNFFDFPMI